MKYLLFVLYFTFTFTIDITLGDPRSVPEFGDQSQILNEISKEIGSVFIETDDLGVIIKADTIGSIEALTIMLKRNSVPIRRADIGRVSKRDVVEAATVMEKISEPFDGSEFNQN